MAFRVFSLPAVGDEAADSVLNGFLRSHRVLAVRRKFVDVGRDSFWSIGERRGRDTSKASREF